MCNVPTRSHYQLHYLERVWYAQVKGTTYWQLLLQREGNALPQGLLWRWERTRRGNEAALASSSALGSETHAGEVGTEGPAGGTEMINRLQKETHVCALARQLPQSPGQILCTAGSRRFYHAGPRPAPQEAWLKAFLGALTSGA